MRTKTVLLTAVLGAVGVATAFGQVYSVNVVGYVNATICPGWNLIANPLDNTGGNGVAKILTGVPTETIVFVYRGGGFKDTTFDLLGDGLWTDDTITLEPGEGFWLFWPGTTGGTVTFVGDVMQDDALTNPIPAGLSMRGSMVPQKGALATVLGYPAQNEDVIFTYVYGTGCTAASFVTYGFGNVIEDEWDDTEPVIDVGQAFWVNKKAGTSWVRNFHVQ